MKKTAQKIFVVVGLIVLLTVGGWYFAIWCVQGAFKASPRNDYEPLSNVVKASLGNTLARSDVKFDGSSTKSGGALDFYQANPKSLRKDVNYFETWSRALAIAKRGDVLSGWQSSEVLVSLSQSERLDGWNHNFCFKSINGHALVISAGPDALTSLNCSELKVAEDIFKSMPHGRLNMFGSGALALIIDSPQKS